MIGTITNILKRTGLLPILFFFLLILINIFLVKLPLTRYFSYEYAVINSTVLSFFSSLIFINLFRKLDTDFSPKNFLGNYIKTVVLLVLIPFIIAFINSYTIQYCPFTDGIPFYLVIVLPSVIIGAGLSVISILLTRRFTYIAVICLYILILLIPVFEIAINPQVYFYNPIVAYFPGNIYDEGISVDMKFFTYRLFNTLFFGGIVIVYLYFNKRIEKNKTAFLLMVSLISITFLYISPWMGFSTTNDSIKNELKNKIETANVDIYYAGNYNDDYKKYLAGLHDFYYQKLVAFFNLEFSEKPLSYIFKNREEKRVLFGAGNADVAKPWLYQIYLSDESVETTLKHELAHIFSAEFGKYYFKVADGFNPALIEGVAMAADDTYGGYNIHYLAAVAANNGYYYKLSDLFKGFSFFAVSSGLSYVYAGSFTAFLIDKYGMQKLKVLYGNIDFISVYGKSIYELEEEYNLFLSAIETRNSKAMANYFFGRPSLLQKACPRYLANETNKLFILIAQKEYAASLELANKLEELGTNYSITIGKALSLEKLGRVKESIEYLEKELLKYKGTAYEYNLLIRLADNLILSGRPDSASCIYQRIVIENPHIRLTNIALTRIELMSCMDTLKKYISGEEIDRLNILKDLNMAKTFYPSIPVLIEIFNNRKLNYKELFSSINQFEPVSNLTGYYAALKLSEYALQNYDFENALRFLKIAEGINEESLFKQLVVNQREKLNWFIKRKRN